MSTAGHLRNERWGERRSINEQIKAYLLRYVKNTDFKSQISLKQDKFPRTQAFFFVQSFVSTFTYDHYAIAKWAQGKFHERELNASRSCIQ